MAGTGDRDADVIVVGGGGAGLAAAATAAEAGARVRLIETADRLGGTTGLSSGVYYAAGTSVQAQRGITSDSADDFYRYYLAANQGCVEPAVVRILCDRAAESLEWLMSTGVAFPPEDLYVSCLSGVPRGHKAADFGAGIVAGLEREIAGRHVEVQLNSRVERLMVNPETGGVEGVEVAGQMMRAPAVVLATGGLGYNRAMWQAYYPDAVRTPSWTWPVSSPGCFGDAITLGLQAGAAIQGANAGSLALTPNFAKRMEMGGRQGWMIYVNREGRRFVDELMISYYQTKVVQAQTGAMCFAVFDESIRRMMQPQPPSAYSSYMFTDNWTAERLAAMADAGRVYRCDTLQALGEACGLDSPHALANTVARYNADVIAGADAAYFKHPAALRLIETPPFYAVELRPAIISLTNAGVRIDGRGRAISRDETPIQGLYAAGSASGSVMGEQYVGGGASITNAIVFGRIAGAEAAAFDAVRG